MWCVFVLGKGDKEKIFSFQGIALLEKLCAVWDYKLTETSGGFRQLLSHAALKWNNEVEQIRGNFDNKYFTALLVKINGARGHLHMAYFRQAVFDLWRSWVVSMSRGGTRPFWDHCASHLIFMSKCSWQENVLFNIFPNPDPIFPAITNCSEGSPLGENCHEMSSVLSTKKRNSNVKEHKDKKIVVMVSSGAL